MKSVDPLLFRQPSPKYNCLDFVAEAWRYLVGDGQEVALLALCKAAHEGEIPKESIRAFERLREPITPCFVVFQRPKLSPHVGIYIDRRVLHLQPNGAEFQAFDVINKCLNYSARFYR
jgi:hypothetical protein